ncbi:unnamed protein product [Menidia menidia]|uniref:(Atlantic silverside) hypothetical protein n=1 Tax=Menidia menidia TaxID=238744 RepID=A0A8S4BSS9_9TELE|nr:unnamed protein product [Menidia menidia]
MEEEGQETDDRHRMDRFPQQKLLWHCVVTESSPLLRKECEEEKDGSPSQYFVTTQRETSRAAQQPPPACASHLQWHST